MIYKGKFKIIDSYITACDYDFLLNKIEESIKKNKNLLISPIASHTLVKAHYDRKLKKILDKFNYLVPDSQWVKKSIGFLYGNSKGLKERVYGPDLMLYICSLCNKKPYKIFLYGNTSGVLNILEKKLKKEFFNIEIVAKEESKFRDLSNKEWMILKAKIERSKANIVLISLGSPKQEVFSYTLSKLINKPLIIIPIGAAFDFISGVKSQAPKFIQNIGMEWFFRMLKEPRRLFTRYMFYGFLFIFLIIFRKIKTH